MIDPKCLRDNHRWGYRNEGFILPCCYMWSAAPVLVPELLQDKFNLSNVNSIDEILNSEEWKNFFEKIKNSQDCPWDLCKRYCPKNDD